MPKSKLNPIARLRKQCAADRRARVPPKTGSAFDTLSKQNRKHEAKVLSSVHRGSIYEKPPPTKSGSVAPVRKKPGLKKVVKPVSERNVKKPVEPLPPEYWRPAGGIARVSTWRLQAFQKAVMGVIEMHVDFAEMAIKEFKHGGESVTDVFVRFSNEAEAARVKREIDGIEVEGRRLRITYC